MKYSNNITCKACGRRCNLIVAEIFCLAVISLETMLDRLAVMPDDNAVCCIVNNISIRVQNSNTSDSS